ncbi:MAG: glycosyltransferase family 4 protein [bacterium]|nr:glycosyltransferase family 4 protein [bacterium]
MALAGRRVLIDATGASIGGGYTYLVNVLPRLCAMAPRGEFRLMLRNPRLIEVLSPIAEREANLEIVALPEAGVSARLVHTFFAMPKLAAQWGAEVFFSVGEVAPLRMPCATIASFRNANVFTREVPAPDLRDRLRFLVLHVIARLAARSCDRIMFVSRDSADWIGDSLGLPEARRAVIHHGIDAAQWSTAEPHRGHGRPYILSVSSIYHYKNYVRLIEAWTRVAKRADREAIPDLVIIGDDCDLAYREQMEASREAAGDLAGRIHILGGVPYEDVKSWCRGAALFVFPSYLETFGHPLLEAMAAGVPLVASGIDSFREVAGDAALFFPYDDVEALANAIESALCPETAAELVRKGNARIQHFTWDASAEALLALFAQVVAEREPG